ncbi:SDR family NAD(P)-dependent oxidoreductase [Streptomyces misionensis]|uniref:SDR family NAD(P)-dependent oxidoreductase n=1 Tax=Streptomyces misionensis TaxID=67331 RepID=UPI0036A1661E
MSIRRPVLPVEWPVVTPGPDAPERRRDDRLGLRAGSRAARTAAQPTGAGFAAFGPFHQADPDRLRREITVDVTAVADISRAFIGQLRTADRGVLVNVASMAAHPLPQAVW